MLRNPTCYDAVKIIKYETFLQYLREYHIDLVVYNPKDESHGGMFYVVLVNSDLVEDITWCVDSFKKTFEMIDVEAFKERIGTDELMGYETTIDKLYQKNEVKLDDD